MRFLPQIAHADVPAEALARIVAAPSSAKTTRETDRRPIDALLLVLFMVSSDRRVPDTGETIAVAALVRL
jgi:hypothetical protein